MPRNCLDRIHNFYRHHSNHWQSWRCRKNGCPNRLEPKWLLERSTRILMGRDLYVPNYWLRLDLASLVIDSRIQRTRDDLVDVEDFPIYSCLPNHHPIFFVLGVSFLWDHESGRHLLVRHWLPEDWRCRYRHHCLNKRGEGRQKIHSVPWQSIHSTS